MINMVIYVCDALLKVIILVDGMVSFIVVKITTKEQMGTSSLDHR